MDDKNVVVYASSRAGNSNPPHEVFKLVISADGQKVVSSEPLNPRYDLANHSPDGFNWGYGGSGPSQLALAILADRTSDFEAQRLHILFKNSMVSQVPGAGQFECAAPGVDKWLEDNR